MCALRRESTAFKHRSVFGRFWASRLAPDSETCTACVSTFCVVSGTVHAVLLSPVLDVDEACYYTSTSRTVGRRQPCYRWSSTYRHWSVLLWWDPNDVPHRRILPSYEAEWWSVPAPLCWWCCYCLADQLWVLIAYTRRRRINLQTAAQKAIFSMQPRRSSKRVSWSRVPVCQHHSIFVSCNYQRSTLAYMEQSPAELHSLDVTGRFTSEH